jgi:hypothetical protein
VRRPVILAEGEIAAPGTLAVDAPVPGAAAVYSHWQDGGATPVELLADTSTAMLVRAAEDEARWLAPFTTVANHHVDADGLLALACACRPDLARRHGPLLIAAAEAGDFTNWTGPAAFRLMVAIHQRMRDQPNGTALACAITDGLDALITESQQPDAERDAAVTQVEDTIARLQRREGFAIADHGPCWSIAWTRRLGHATDVFGSIYRPDDLPLWALDAVVPRHVFQLTSERTDDGWNHVLEAPRHSWARTVDRPSVAWPDLTMLAEDLARQEPEVRWCARPAAGGIAFTGLLSGRGSQMSPEDVLHRSAAYQAAG